MIEELYHRTADAPIKTRSQILLLEASPMSVPQIAQVIFYSEDTVARCIHEFHFAKPVLAKFSAYPEQIELVRLPTYSPQLNPVGRFWKQGLCKVTHTTFFQTIERLLDAVTGFLRDMSASPPTVRSVAGLAAYVSPVS